MNTGNLFDNAAPPTCGERFETLLQHKNLVIERICSSADIPLSQYVQTQDEWVLLVQGTAEIEIDGTLELLKSGDYVFCPPTRLTACKKYLRARCGLRYICIRDKRRLGCAMGTNLTSRRIPYANPNSPL